ncbi:DUF1376 domain-containing protein [Hyphomonas sp.]|uniref:DUF1376 domain-containing protein n=1 Tax=Hyphomonas sp. TaxID=87 RepID=UPI000C96BD48|nr:DUF1376 domain-containing protein [Hyphomonas sp.]MAL46604.1 hypothetical protein [Hyphomonas sp.]
MDGKEINKFHALQLFTDTFAAETVHLTNEEVGIYIRLLCFAWTKNAKPFSIRSAYRIGQCIDDDCKGTVKKVLYEFFKMNGEDEYADCWTHKRLVQEHDYLTKKYKKRSEAGKKGGLARSKNVAPIPIPSPSPNKYINSFSEIWDKLCIKRGSKFKAHQIYLKVHDEIDGIQHHIAEIFNKQMKGIEDKFVPHFSTWLSQKRWEDYQNQDESITIKQKMEKLGYVFRHTESNFDYFKKDGIEYKIDKYDKDHIIHKVE